jgi:hypothetical protein
MGGVRANASALRWRRTLRREVAAWLILKALALGLIWLLFFSGAHERVVGAHAASARLGLAPHSAPVDVPAHD